MSLASSATVGPAAVGVSKGVAGGAISTAGSFKVGVARIDCTAEVSDELSSDAFSVVGLRTLVIPVFGFSTDVWFSFIKIDDPRSFTKIGVP